MTNKELQNQLKDYPDDFQIELFLIRAFGSSIVGNLRVARLDNKPATITLAGLEN